MKLSEPFKLQSTESGGFYARALRAIGQDLAELYPERIEIERQGEDFVVRGTCARSRLETEKPKSERKSLKEILAQDITAWAPQSKSDSASFSRTYDAEDIARIDEIGSRRRTGVEKIPDIRGLGEILRTVGRVIESEDGRLIKIIKDMRQVAFEYVNRDGANCKQELSSLDLRKVQQRFYEKRGETKPRTSFKLKD
ncbi:MAG: hypothetical protein ACREO5_13805 [Candidatus Binatia bacterium]